jgi:hypothetical protein
MIFWREHFASLLASIDPAAGVRLQPVRVPVQGRRR